MDRMRSRTDHLAGHMVSAVTTFGRDTMSAPDPRRSADSVRLTVALRPGRRSRRGVVAAIRVGGTRITGTDRRPPGAPGRGHRYRCQLVHIGRRTRPRLAESRLRDPGPPGPKPPRDNGYRPRSAGETAGHSPTDDQGTGGDAAPAGRSSADPSDASRHLGVPSRRRHRAAARSQCALRDDKVSTSSV